MDIDDAIRATERALDIGRQQFPDDPNFKTAEADFARLLNDHERSLRALRSAFLTNSRDPYIAARLARIHERQGDTTAAMEVLHRALEQNPNDKQLNFSYAEVLRVTNPSATHDLIYHFRRAFTKWDDNYEAQFWYARYAFESEDSDRRLEAKLIFRRLRDVPMRSDARHRVRDRITVDAQPKRIKGTVARMQFGFGFITTDGRGDTIFFHRNDIDDTTWDDLVDGSRVAFEIAFTFGGPLAVQVEIA
jgi:cold shock CspA family protein